MWIILCSMIFTSLDSDEVTVGQAIQWKEIPGSSGYIVEVENETGQIIQKKSINTPKLYLNLNVGNYRFRIIALNRFRKIGKVYPWKKLVVKPVEAPFVRESPLIYNPNQTDKTFLVKGDFLHRGTLVELVGKNKKRYRAKVVVLRDGSGIEVLPPLDLPDGDYTVSYKNTRGKPFIDKVAIDSTVPTQLASFEKKEKIARDLAKKEDSILPFFSDNKDEDTEQKLPAVKKDEDTDKKLPIVKKEEYTDQKIPVDKDDRYSDSELVPRPSTYSLLWRQALIPGWGHYHAGHKKTGGFYFLGTVLLAGAAIHTNQVYTARRNDYSATGQFANLIAFSGNSNPNLELFNQLDLNGKFTDANTAKVQAGNAGAALGGFYVLSLVHILFTGAFQDEADSAFILESFPEIWNNQIGTKYRAGYRMNF